MGSFMTLIYYGVGDGGGTTAVAVPATAVVLAAALGRATVGAAPAAAAAPLAEREYNDFHRFL